MVASRRNFVTGLGALFLAAPAVVRATSLMPISAAKIEAPFMYRHFHTAISLGYAITREAIINNLSMGFAPIKAEGTPYIDWLPDEY